MLLSPGRQADSSRLLFLPVLIPRGQPLSKQAWDVFQVNLVNPLGRAMWLSGMNSLCVLDAVEGL